MTGEVDEDCGGILSLTKKGGWELPVETTDDEFMFYSVSNMYVCE